MRDARCAMRDTADAATESAVVRRVLERERELAALERILGFEAVTAVKALSPPAGVILRHGERLWASPCLSRLDDLGLVALWPATSSRSSSGSAIISDMLRP
jgi:hypothetical protein